MLEVWGTAVRYHMWHTLALLAVSALPTPWQGRATRIACVSWLAGVVLFSGSLYALALTGVSTFGVITPIGGVALIAGWSALAVAAARAR